MSVVKVTATINSISSTLTNSSGDEYDAQLTSPTKKGDYSVTITAIDEAGNVSQSYNELNVEAVWQEPKIDWVHSDRFNYWDYNRIKNNIEYIYKYAKSLRNALDDSRNDISIKSMGDDIHVYDAFWDVNYFNSWWYNIAKINNNTFIKYMGFLRYDKIRTFYRNTLFITYHELNTIEQYTLKIKNLLDGEKAGLQRLSFRLGNNDIKI